MFVSLRCTPMGWFEAFSVFPSTTTTRATTEEKLRTAFLARLSKEKKKNRGTILWDQVTDEPFPYCRGGFSLFVFCFKLLWQTPIALTHTHWQCCVVDLETVFDSQERNSLLNPMNLFRMNAESLGANSDSRWM